MINPFQLSPIVMEVGLTRGFSPLEQVLFQPALQIGRCTYMNEKQLLNLVIDPVLDALHLNSASARLLLLMTAAAESNLGQYLKQYPNGPALGIYMIERRTYYDIFDSVLDYHPGMKNRILKTCDYVMEPSHNCLIWDLRLATAMARIQYWRWPEKLPDNEDLDGLIQYYYKYWGPNPDKTSIDESKNRIFSILHLTQGVKNELS